MEGDSCQMEVYQESNESQEQMTVYEVCELEEGSNSNHYYSSVSDHGCSDSGISPPKGSVEKDKKGYYPQRYREAWEKLPEFKGWLRRSHINRKNPFCCACNCELIGGKSELQRHAKSSKHKRMLQTLSAEGLVAHPTVRVKGTENNYTPVQCVDTDCSDIPAHVHCPLCLKKERAFQEPVALDIHFQEIHVEKSLDFGGLRILCCCLDCDICVPARGGDQSKKISGSHWHCFRCRRGFNRRSEANRHYRSHFKNPNATMEIHISQEVHVPQMLEGEEASPVMDMTDNLTNLVESILTNAASTSQTSIVRNDEIANIPATATAQEDEDGNVIMVFQTEDEAKDERSDAASGSQDLQTAIISASDGTLAKSNKSLFEKMTMAFVGEIRKLKSHVTKVEQQLTSEVNQLKALVQQQAREIQELRKQEEPVSSAEGPLYQLLNTLQSQHTDMLRKHLQQVKQAAYIAAVRDIKQGSVSSKMDSNSSSTDLPNSSTSFLAENDTSQAFGLSSPSVSAGEVLLPATSPSPSKSIAVKNVSTSTAPTVINLRPSIKELSD